MTRAYSVWAKRVHAYEAGGSALFPGWRQILMTVDLVAIAIKLEAVVVDIDVNCLDSSTESKHQNKRG